MSESIFPGLPNLHAAVVHFPVALLLTALLLDLAALCLRRVVWLDRAALLLWLLGWIGTCAAFLSGHRAADALNGLSGAADLALWEHADLALYTLVAFTVVIALRLLAARLEQTHQATRPSALRLVVLVLAIVAQALVITTADHGGALVYRHGVAVQRPASPA